VLCDDQSWSTRFDAVIVSNLSPVHAAARLAHWRRRSAGLIPVIDLFASEAQEAAPRAA